MESQWKYKIFEKTATSFNEVALAVFRYQYEHNKVYRSFTDALQISVAAVKSIHDIPFLPIRLFKTHEVVSGLFEPQAIFESSGTTSSQNSRHLIKELNLYEASFLRAVENNYGHIEDYIIIGLLPSYLERGNSSLVYMVNSLIHKSKQPESGFYLYEWDKLASLLAQTEKEKKKVLLIGVTFALLDFAEHCPMPLQHTTIIETGGMKGRRKEIIREEVHSILKKAFSVSTIHSEYGMTELLSQAWSKGNGIFQTPHWMKVLIRDEEDPLHIHSESEKAISGAINIIDLGNIHSCSFIATDDAGRLHPNGNFEVLGRIDNSDIRGCSLMYL